MARTTEAEDFVSVFGGAQRMDNPCHAEIEQIRQKHARLWKAEVKVIVQTSVDRIMARLKAAPRAPAINYLSWGAE